MNILPILLYNFYSRNTASVTNDTTNVPSFKDLKKELKYVDKLNKDHLDIKSWASEIELWIQLQNITDPKTIFVACLLTSTGEPRQIIQELELPATTAEEDVELNGSTDTGEMSGSSTSSSTSSSSSSNDSVRTNRYPSFVEIVNALEVFYGAKEDQNTLLRELRALKIGRNEKVRDFNKRYRTLYLKLDKTHKKQISILDYADALENNIEAWKRVTLIDDIPLSKAYEIAEKVDRLAVRLHRVPSPNRNVSNNNNNNYNKSRSSPPRNTYENRDNRKVSDESERENLTRGPRNSTVKTCFFCKEPGHYQQHCPKLQAIIEENKKQIFSKGPLNQ